MNFNFYIFIIAITIDSLWGDPNYPFHPVRLIGNLIAFLEAKLYRESDDKSQYRNGVLLVTIVLLIVGLVAYAISYFALSYGYWGVLPLAIIMSQLLASKSLIDEGEKILKIIESEDINLARKEISYLVSRDTDKLKMSDIAKAAVETMIENTTDAIIAPLFYFAIFGFTGIVVYKAINTMDSMIGYHSERYEYFGKFAARLDDVANFLPARLAAFLLLLASLFRKGNFKLAWKCFKNQRQLSTSVNAGCTESVFAGATEIKLSGPTEYFGKITERPYIGYGRKKIKADDLKESIAYVKLLAMLAYCWLLVILV